MKLSANQDGIEVTLVTEFPTVNMVEFVDLCRSVAYSLSFHPDLISAHMPTESELDDIVGGMMTEDNSKQVDLIFALLQRSAPMGGTMSAGATITAIWDTFSVDSARIRTTDDAVYATTLLDKSGNGNHATKISV